MYGVYVFEKHDIIKENDNNNNNNIKALYLEIQED